MTWTWPLMCPPWVPVPRGRILEGLGPHFAGGFFRGWALKGLGLYIVGVGRFWRGWALPRERVFICARGDRSQKEWIVAIDANIADVGASIVDICCQPWAKIWAEFPVWDDRRSLVTPWGRIDGHSRTWYYSFPLSLRLLMMPLLIMPSMMSLWQIWGSIYFQITNFVQFRISRINRYQIRSQFDHPSCFVNYDD